MSKLKINLRRYERSLLTDVAPYETPVLYSNWGSYYAMMLYSRGGSLPRLFREIYTNRTTKLKYSIPFDYYIRKNDGDRRKLSLIHPFHSIKIVEFYRKYDLLVTKLCCRSNFSIRSPYRIAKHYVNGKSIERSEATGVEDLLSADSQYASSYFSYSRFSHLHKFFESAEFLELEKRYDFMTHFDVVKCFPSIYTHSISWAYRGKVDAKFVASSSDFKGKFDIEFDKLMQEMNYNETNGLVVGSELARIFAEIIFQRIDVSLESALKAKGFELGRDYWCVRYIDDFYLFSNSSALIESFSLCLQKALEEYKLYLNVSKMVTSSGPFITPVSMAKLEVKGFCAQLFSRAASGAVIGVKHEMNVFRSIIKRSGGGVGDVSSLFLSALKGGYASLDASLVKDYCAFVGLLVDLAFYCLSSSPKVPESYKVCSFITMVDFRLKLLDVTLARPIRDKISYEVRSFVESGADSGAILEVLNLLIVTKGRFDMLISQDVVVGFMNSIKRVSVLSYFEIVSLLYFVGKRPNYAVARAMLLKEALLFIKAGDFVIDSSRAHLLIDLMSCPFISKQTKIVILKSACRSASLVVTDSDFREFCNFCSKSNWYFNWNKKDDIRLFLRKKEYMPAY